MLKWSFWQRKKDEESNFWGPDFQTNPQNANVTGIWDHPRKAMNKWEVTKLFRSMDWCPGKNYRKTPYESGENPWFPLNLHLGAAAADSKKMTYQGAS